jgi:hypothetical protein
MHIEFIFKEGIMIQEVAWGVSIALMGTLAGVFAWVAVGARVARADDGTAIAGAYRLRTWLFAAAVLFLIGVNYRTLRELPYLSSMALAASGNAQ